MGKRRTTSPPRNSARDGLAAAHRLQYGALPWRWRTSPSAGVDGSVADHIEVLLVSTRETRRWIVPKGWPMKDRTPHGAAAQEAMEEAGLVGIISKTPLGTYFYQKRMRNGSQLPCKVEVFPMQVTQQLPTWREAHQRKTRWFPVSVAAEKVYLPGLRDLILNLHKVVGDIPPLPVEGDIIRIPTPTPSYDRPQGWRLPLSQFGFFNRLRSRLWGTA